MNFADTGAFLSLYHRNDQHHREALALWPLIERPVFTSNLVIAELARLLSHRIGHEYAVANIADIYNSTTITVLPSTRADEIGALDWMLRFAGQNVSFTDCVSFSLMRRNRIRTAFTFDRHFLLAGFQIFKP